MNPQKTPDRDSELGGVRKLPIDLGTDANMMYSPFGRFVLNHVRYWSMKSMVSFKSSTQGMAPRNANLKCWKHRFE
jgi:hypothetical protein